MSSNASPSQRSEIAPFIVMDIMREANALEAQGQDIIHMEVGQPAAPAPKPVLAAAQAVINNGRLGYTEALGIPALRDRIARHYGEKYDIDIAANRIVITTGSSGAFTLAFLASFDIGARIGLPTPGYPAYRNIVKALGLQPVDLQCTAQDRWAPSPQMLQEANLDGLLLASPANPSGTCLTPEALEAICVTCRQEGITFLSDEIYHGLSYESADETALKYDDNTIIINSFSKYYCMTGWRIGWMVVPERLIRPVERLAQNLFISAPYASQVAAIEAFNASDELEKIKQGYAQNRAHIMQTFPTFGLTNHLPIDGAFYAYFDISDYTQNASAFANAMLHETGIAATPGLDFDPTRGESYLRFSFAGSEERIQEAGKRLAHWLGGNP